MKTTLDTLKDLAIHFSNHNFKIYLSYENEMLDINTSATIYIKSDENNPENKIVYLSFEVIGNTTLPALITKTCYDYFVSLPNYRIHITDPYHLIFDSNGKYINSLYGLEAVQFANSVNNDDNSKEIEKIKKSCKKEDKQKKIDRLLDKVSKNGDSSLTQKEREFLKNS